MDYRQFLARKHLVTKPSGFDISADNILPTLFPWQRDIVAWALRRGRAALWEDCGLGKTIQQLEWSRVICESTGGKVLILCPLAVAQQTRREADKFGVQAEVVVARDQSHVGRQITITNYERLHLFDTSEFVGVVLDESSCLKAYTGKTKQQLIRDFTATPYKLACSATPAPNDRLELGNHSEFLGIMPSNEMIARWFINNSMKCGGYVLRPYAAKEFWRWIASWAICIGKPSDLGHDDNGFVIPPLRIHEHVVDDDSFVLGKDYSDVSATTVHREKRAVLSQRADCVAELVNDNDESWAVWCDTDYEADALRKRIPDAIEVRGSHSTESKERGLESFSSGESRVIITKPEIGGFGLNWQHCHNTTWFAGFSYERWYQSIRRLWRFGQTRPVHCHLVMSVAEQSIKKVVDRKAKEHTEMQCEMAAQMRDGMMEELYDHKTLAAYHPAEITAIPNWLSCRA